MGTNNPLNQPISGPSNQTTSEQSKAASDFIIDRSSELDDGFQEYERDLRFGAIADIHGRGNTNIFDNFITAMNTWDPMFIIDLGDWAVQCVDGYNYNYTLYTCQRNRCIDYYENHYENANMPHFNVIGNHDVAWIDGGRNTTEYDTVTWQDLWTAYNDSQVRVRGEHLPKREFVEITNMPYKYYAFTIKANNTGYRFYVLDGNNYNRDKVDCCHDEEQCGGYVIDDEQFQFIVDDMEQHPTHKKIVFSHEPLWWDSSVECGDCKPGSYIGNGWKLREKFAEDENVLVCFHGHRHYNMYRNYGGVHYIGLEDAYSGTNYAKITITSNKLIIEGVGNQADYELDI